jgi:hypothetical protein
MHNKKQWNKIEEQFVKDNATKLTDAEGAMQLSRIIGEYISTRSWRRKRNELGIKKQRGKGLSKLGMPASG